MKVAIWNVCTLSKSVKSRQEKNPLNVDRKKDIAAFGSQEVPIHKTPGWGVPPGRDLVNTGGNKELTMKRKFLHN